MGTGLGELRTEQSSGSRNKAARVRGKSEEQWGKETAGSWHVAARWVGAQGWVQSHKLLLSGWPWCQLPQRSSCSEPPTPTLALGWGHLLVITRAAAGGAGKQHGVWVGEERQTENFNESDSERSVIMTRTSIPSSVQACFLKQ